LIKPLNDGDDDSVGNESLIDLRPHNSGRGQVIEMKDVSKYFQAGNDDIDSLFIKNSAVSESGHSSLLQGFKESEQSKQELISRLERSIKEGKFGDDDDGFFKSVTRL